MRNGIIFVVLVIVLYGGYRLISGGGETPDQGEGGGAPIVGQEPDSGWPAGDPGRGEPADPPRMIGSDPGEESNDGGTPVPVATEDDDAGPVPAVGEIATLEQQLRGTLSPEKDDLRIRLAEVYREYGRDVDADGLYRQVYRAKGPYAARAAVALLDRTTGELRAEAAAYVVRQGTQTPGYGKAARVHGETLAAQPEEAAQLEGWRLLSDAYFSRSEESWRAPLRSTLEKLAEHWLLSRRPCTLATSYSVQSGDYLARIAEDHHVTVEQIQALNGLDSDLIHPGDRLKILDRPITVEVDKSEFRLDVRYDGGFLLSFPVGHGAEGRTPVADFVVDLCQKQPTWFPANRPPVPYGEPGNPLGERWLGFKSQEGLKGFGIHGTNQPETIGTEASEGCVRLRNEDVIRLYPFVAVGTPVTVRE